jgi:hypothetical protein
VSSSSTFYSAVSQNNPSATSIDADIASAAINHQAIDAISAVQGGTGPSDPIAIVGRDEELLGQQSDVSMTSNHAVSELPSLCSADIIDTLYGTAHDDLSILLHTDAPLNRPTIELQTDDKRILANEFPALTPNRKSIRLNQIADARVTAANKGSTTTHAAVAVKLLQPVCKRNGQQKATVKLGKRKSKSNNAVNELPSVSSG